MQDFASSQEDPRVLAVIEEMIERVRTILDLFEGIIHEVWHVAQIVMDMIAEIRELFRFGKGSRSNRSATNMAEMEDELESYAPVA